MPSKSHNQLLPILNDIITNKRCTPRLCVPEGPSISSGRHGGFDLTLERRSKFAPITAVTVTWWKREGDEFRAAMRERDQSKIGRLARLKGVVETAEAKLPGLRLGGSQ